MIDLQEPSCCVLEVTAFFEKSQDDLKKHDKTSLINSQHKISNNLDSP
jgi:hypothetical protein